MAKKKVSPYFEEVVYLVADYLSTIGYEKISAELLNDH